MPFAATTKARVIMALELPVTVPAYVQYVEDALTSAETYGGETVVTAIEALLTQYETAQTSLNSSADNAGLIRADVLEWSPGQRTGGISKEMARLQGKISKTLMLDCLMPNRANRIQIARG